MEQTYAMPRRTVVRSPKFGARATFYAGNEADAIATFATDSELLPPDMKVLMNHIYEFKKGVRQMVLFTCNRRYEQFTTQRLQHQGIDCVVQPAGRENINVYFGRRECLDAIRLFVTRPLNELSPEEDFILGAMLGYDICTQCERYCQRKKIG